MHNPAVPDLRAGHTVIVGAGQAGVQLADSLRTLGYAGGVSIIGEELVLPYQRPPLSKDYMAAGPAPQPLPLRAEAFYREHGVDLRLGVRVSGIDRQQHLVELDDGGTVPYSALVLATGAANRELAVPGSGLEGIHGLRTLADAQGIQGRLGQVRSVVVVGAGFIGLEFAAAARQRGLEVTVLEFADRPMGRALSPAMSAYFAQAHRANGVRLRLGEGIASFDGTDGHVSAAISTTGERYPADLVLVGVGVLPHTELAQTAGLAVDNGVVVDSMLRTSDPDIYALGDCASYPSPQPGGRIRLESVQNATDQARHLAAVLTGGSGDYAELPWFWSQQGHLKLQIAGLLQPECTTVLRGDPATDKFSVFCFSAGQLAAVESVNQPADHMAARRLLGQSLPLTPAQAADPTFDLKGYSKLQPLPA